MRQIKRKPLIAGNWKMHGSKEKVRSLLSSIIQGAGQFAANVEIVVLPTFVHLSLAKDLLTHTSSHSHQNHSHSHTQSHAAGHIALGAQNLYPGDQGAFTGEVAGPMLVDSGCEYVLIGHSERRNLFNETLPVVAAKFKAALDAGLKPILCVGETRGEREEEQTERILREQLQSVIDHVGIQSFKEAVIAYEPVWAIGTGLTATPEQAEETQAYIRQYLKQINVDLAETIRILYGGSMKADNAQALLAMPDIDGGLIGGASLDAGSFLAICAAANAACTTNSVSLS